MVESNSNNQFYTQYHTPRPTRIQTPRNNIIAYSIANKRRRDNQAKRKKEWNDVVRRVRASLNPTPVRTQRIKSTPRRVNTTQTPVNYNKIVKEAINESNAVKALLNLNRKPDANKQKKAAFTKGRDLEKKRKYMREYYHKKKETMTEANKEKKRKQKRESARKMREKMTEADKEAKRQLDRERYHKRMELMTEANKKKKANSMTEANREKIRKQRREWARKRREKMTEADKEEKRQRKREWYRKRREKNLWSYGII